MTPATVHLFMDNSCPRADVPFHDPPQTREQELWEKLGTQFHCAADAMLRALEAANPDTPVRLWGAYSLDQVKKAIQYQRRIRRLIKQIWEETPIELEDLADVDPDSIDTELWTPDVDREELGGAK